MVSDNALSLSDNRVSQTNLGVIVMPVGAGDVLLVTYKGSLADQIIMTTFHYGMSTVTGAPTQDAVATEVLTKLSAVGGQNERFLNCCPDNYNLDEVWVQFILDTRYRKKVGFPNVGGNFGFQAYGTNQAGVISRFGPAANRRNQGNIHIPIGASASWLLDGKIIPAWRTAANLLAPFLYNPQVLATTGTISPILIHGTSKLNAIPLVSAQVQETARVMRRRTVGVGI